ncbi:MAG: hypothetical protein LBT38_03540 [Deltaproteobacteria bacterium]|jgi:hypothetical protein|nr:hypothetical protein [Deltaproteobacteria bacterium]
MVFARLTLYLILLVFSFGAGLATAQTPPNPNFPVELEARFAEAKSLLLSAQASDLGQSYRYQMDKAVVIFYQASLLNPNAPEVWLRLGRLAEIRSLWAEDPQAQEVLMEEARGHFLKAARLGYDQAHQAKPEPPKTAANPADPFVANLLWSGRLRRGEISSEELTAHYAFNSQNPLFHPNLWSERRFILLAERDPHKRAQLLTSFQKEFDEAWAIMPALVPNQRQEPRVLKKFDVLLAWIESLLFMSGPFAESTLAGTTPPLKAPSPLNATNGTNATPVNGTIEESPGPVSPAPKATEKSPEPDLPSSNALNKLLANALDNLSSSQNAEAKVEAKVDPDKAPPEPLAIVEPSLKREALFNAALALYPKALSLPLDSSEMGLLLTRLDQTELLSPTPTQRDAVWVFRDQFFAKYLKVANNDPEVWAAWGRDLYHRADSLADQKLWEARQTEAANKFTESVKLSPDKARAYARWGQALEFGAYSLAPFLNLPPDSLSQRRQKTLTEAQNLYQKAWDLGQKLDNLESLARVSLFLAFAAKDKAVFTDLFAQATLLGHQTVRSSDNPAGAWLNWARHCLTFQARGLNPEWREYALAEVFAAYNHYLALNVARIPNLIEMADGIWSMAAQYPEAQDQALNLLIDICRRLSQLAPQEPGYSFALGLTVFAQLANRPAWPDDPSVTSDLTAKKALQEVLSAFADGLESLAVWRPNSDSPPPAGQAQAYEPLRFLVPEIGQAWVYAPAATFQERLASALNRPVGRLLAMARPETLPPWHQLQLAAFLRLAAASGYPPPEEQMAYWRLALRLLRLAGSKETDNPDLGSILAEEGLVLAELNLLNRAPDPGLLKQAQALWERAEKIAPGSSHYAKARWAAWRGDRAELEKSLAHPPAWEDNLTWPSFPRAISDPAFRPYRSEPWLKAAWFGYSR